MCYWLGLKVSRDLDGLQNLRRQPTHDANCCLGAQVGLLTTDSWFSFMWHLQVPWASLLHSVVKSNRRNSSDSRGEEINSTSWCEERFLCSLGKSCHAPSWEAHYPGKREGSIHPPPQSDHAPPPLRAGQWSTKRYKTCSNSGASPEPNFLHSLPGSLPSRHTGRHTASQTPQALSYLKEFAVVLLSGMESILQLSKKFLPSLLEALKSMSGKLVLTILQRRATSIVPPLWTKLCPPSIHMLKP